MIINWCGYEWLTQERWGQIHPEHPHQWYDPFAVIPNNDELLLYAYKKPKYFPDLKITSPTAVGLVSCLEKFSYGTFELEAKMPKGKQTWPAFWMYSWSDWPPEIDVFESYSNNKQSYFKFRILRPLGFWNVQTCLHYRDNSGNHTMIKPKTHWFGFKDPSTNYIKYKVEWFKDVINYYYNDRLVRTIKDSFILNQFKGQYMNVVINNAISETLNPDEAVSNIFKVKNFKYTPY